MNTEYECSPHPRGAQRAHAPRAAQVRAETHAHILALYESSVAAYFEFLRLSAGTTPREAPHSPLLSESESPAGPGSCALGALGAGLDEPAGASDAAEDPDGVGWSESLEVTSHARSLSLVIARPFPPYHRRMRAASPALRLGCPARCAVTATGGRPSGDVLENVYSLIN